MLSSRSSREGGDRADVVVGEAVAGVDLEAERVGEGRHVGQAGELVRLRGGVAGEAGLAVGAGVELDHRRADAVRGLDLPAVGGDEDRDAEPASRSGAMKWARRFSSRATSRPPSVVRSSRRSGTRQTACGRWRSAIACISSVAAISRLSGSVSSAISAVDVGVGDVAAVLAQVRGDAVGAGRLGELARRGPGRDTGRRGRSARSRRGRCSRRAAAGRAGRDAHRLRSGTGVAATYRRRRRARQPRSRARSWARASMRARRRVLVGGDQGAGQVVGDDRGGDAREQAADEVRPEHVAAERHRACASALSPWPNKARIPLPEAADGVAEGVGHPLEVAAGDAVAEDAAAERQRDRGDEREGQRVADDGADQRGDRGCRAPARPARSPRAGAGRRTA